MYDISIYGRIDTDTAYELVKFPVRLFEADDSSLSEMSSWLAMDECWRTLLKVSVIHYQRDGWQTAVETAPR